MKASRFAFHAVFLLALVTSVTQGQTCIDYASHDPYEVPRIWDHPGYATPTRAAVSGAAAYVLDEDGLKVLDVGSLPAVSIVTSLPSSVEFFDLAVFKSRLYLATDHGLRVLDVSDPSQPEPLMTIEPGLVFRTLLLDGGRLFVSGGPESLLIDVGGGEDTITARWSTPGTVLEMARVGDVLWSTNLAGVLIAHDITDPHRFGRIEHDLEAGFAGGLIAVGSYLLAGDRDPDGNMISVVDVSDPAAPSVVTRFASNRLMTLSGTRLIVGDEVYDVSDPTLPVLTGGVKPYDLVIPTAPAVGLVKGFGWESVDLEQPWYPVLASAAPVADDFELTSIHDGLLFAGNGVWNLASPAVPEQLSAGYTVNFYKGWDSLDAGIHYQERRSGVLVADMSDPSAPRKLGTFVPSDLVDDPGTSFMMSMHDGYGYYMYQGVPGFTGRPTLAVFHMGDPLHPKWLGSTLLTTIFDCIDMKKIGDVLFVMTGVGGCRYVDVSDPANPTLLGTLPGRATSTKLIHEGDLLGLAMTSWGVDMYDVSDPTAPVYTGKISTDASVDDVVITGDHAFTLSGGMINVFDISGLPFLVGSFRPPATVAAMDADAERLLVATAGGGWYAYAHDCGGIAELETRYADDPSPRPAAALSVAPNPFNPRTTVSWNQERAGSVTVMVHDLGGRRIATLVDGHRAAGPQSVVWDGADDRGRGQAAGTYMVTLRRDARRDVRKVLLVR